MKFESAAIVISTICIFLTFYFSYLSFQSVDETTKGQFVTLAISSLITGIIILTSIIINLAIKKVFSRIET